MNATKHQSKIGDHVAILPLGTEPVIQGTIRNIRHDDRGDAILTIFLDDPTQAPDGIYYARTFEVKPLADPAKNAFTGEQK